MLNKTNVDNYAKDTTTNVVVNNNMQEYYAYLQARTKLKEAAIFREEINTLKKEMAELKSLMAEFLDRNNQ